MLSEIISFLIAAFFAATAAFVAVTRRHKPSWKAGVILLLSCAEITFAYAMQSTLPDLASQTICYKFVYVGFAVCPTAFLWLAFYYAGVHRWLTWSRLVVLSVMPVVTVVMVATNEWHGWMWDRQSVEAIVRHQQFLSWETGGLWYWWFVGYSYCLWGWAAALLARLLVTSKGVYGWQSTVVLAAAFLAVGGTSADLFHISPFPPFVTTAVGLSSGIITAALSLTVLRRTDLLAVTRSALLDRIADAIIVVDADDLVAETNVAAVKFFPGFGARPLGKPLGSLVPELTSLSGGDEVREVEVRSGGTARVFNLRGARLTDPLSRLMGRVIVLQDVTERKRADDEIRVLNSDLERRVRERTEKLEIANRELEAFAYSVSHDLRAPLRLIDGFSRILVENDGGNPEPDTRHALEVIHRETSRMGLLIDSLLALSRFSRVALSVQRIDMAAMAAETFHSMMTAEECGRIDFVVEDVPFAMGDPVLLQQVWSNLISNAVKFSSPSGHPAITIRGVDGEGETVYSVTDNGVGFDARYASKLFGVFQRLHIDPRFPGTGVGLAIVHRAVQRHGGRVWATGEVDKGASFHFALPKSA